MRLTCLVMSDSHSLEALPHQQHPLEQTSTASYRNDEHLAAAISREILAAPREHGLASGDKGVAGRRVDLEGKLQAQHQRSEERPSRRGSRFGDTDDCMKLLLLLRHRLEDNLVVARLDGRRLAGRRLAGRRLAAGCVTAPGRGRGGGGAGDPAHDGEEALSGSSRDP